MGTRSRQAESSTSGRTPQRSTTAWDDVPGQRAGFAPRTPPTNRQATDTVSARGHAPQSDAASISMACDEARERNAGFDTRSQSSYGREENWQRSLQEKRPSAWEDAEPIKCFTPTTPPSACPRRSASASNIGGATHSAKSRPHTASSINLAWNDEPQSNCRSTPRSSAGRREEPMCDRGPTGNASEAASGVTDPSSAPFGRMMDGCAGKPTYDAGSLHLLKSRMGRKQSNSGASMVSGNQVYDERNGYGFGNFSVPVGQMSQRSASAPRLQGAKDEVEGSRPRKWKPAKNPRAPPGGNPTFHPAMDGEFHHQNGRKRFPDMGPGGNRDANAIEALRFYQEEERLGRLPVERQKPAANQHDRHSHRYYLAADGKADLTPGKMRTSSRVSGIPGFSEPLASQSTSAAGSGEDLPSECDSLPLGAEWSTCCFEGQRLEPLY